MTSFKKNLTFVTLCLTFALTSFGQNHKGRGLQKIADEIASSNRLYNQGFETHNAALVVDRYCTDGAIMAPNSRSITSREGLLAFFNGGYDHGIRKASLRTTAIFGLSATMLNEEGVYELQNEKGQMVDQGKYIVVWKKTRSGWKMYRDIFNTNLSQPGNN